MKCPKCGSDHCQFYSTTKGGGFSAEKSCCGYILIGPLGLLCGALDSKQTTEEFWVCHSCGNRFTTYDSEKKEREIQKQKQEATKYKQYTKEIADSKLTEEEVLRIIEEINQKHTQASIERRAYLEQLCLNDNIEIRSIAKKLYSNFIETLLLIACGIGFISLFIAFPIGLLLIIGAIALLLVAGGIDDKNSQKLCGIDPVFKELDDHVKQLQAEKEKYKELKSKINFVNNYHA